jgi:very-short-patch-repair endonuclease
MVTVSKAEKILAGAMKKIGMRYVQQKPVGYYTVDFLLPPNLIVEVDGPFHLSDKRLKADRRRHEFLESIGYVVMRLSDNKVREDPHGIAKFIAMVHRDPEKYRMYPRSFIAFPGVIEYHNSII